MICFVDKQFNFTTALYISTASVWLYVSVSNSLAVGHGFTSWSGHTKDHNRYGTNFYCLLTWHAGVGVGVWQCNSTVYGTLYWEMHNKGLLGSIIRVCCSIPVLDFKLVLHVHGFLC